MNDRPHAIELIAAVRGFLEAELLPAMSDPRLRFQALVAANVLGIALRELDVEEVMLHEEFDTLAELVQTATGRPERLLHLRDEVRSMNERLCEAIRAAARQRRIALSEASSYLPHERRRVAFARARDAA